MNINIVQLGRMDYKEALEIQEKLLKLRIEDRIQDTLLLVEHPPVLTLGRRGEYSNILVPRQQLEAQGIGIYEVSRGGDITYHGPGQVVGYPIMALKNHGKDIKQFVWNIEEVFIRLLHDQYGITAHREEKKYTGVWVDEEKVTAIGIYVKQWVTMHGFAFNVSTDLEHFQWINPCGITDKGVTSMQKLLGQELDFEAVSRQVVDYFCGVFGVEPVPVEVGALLGDSL